MQQDGFSGDRGTPEGLGNDGTTYGSLLLGELGCVSAGNCVVGGENASGTPLAIYAQESDGGWAGFGPSPVPSDASTDEGAGSESAAVGCDNASDVPVDESPVCTVLGAYTNDGDTYVPYEFTDDLKGSLVAVTSVSSSVGPAGGGETLTITGTGFGSPGDDDTVDFVGDEASVAGLDVVVDSNTEITVTTPNVAVDPSNPDGTDLTPPGTLATDVIVGTPDNGSSEVNPPDDSYTFEPWIDSVSPGEGPAAVGSTITITITGSGFGLNSPADTVAFVPRAGGSPIQASNVVVQSDTTITATVPDASVLFSAGGASADTDVVVTTALGATTPIVGSQSEYTYHDAWVDSVSPADGRLSGGEQVTITGTGFGSTGDDDAVTFTPQGGGGPVEATDVTVLSDTEITATTPDMSTATGDRSIPWTPTSR